MSLELAPRTENILQEYAAREGVNADEAIIRLVEAASTHPRITTVDELNLRVLQAQAHEAISGEAQRAAFHALLSLPKEEIIRRNAPSTALLRAKLDAAANATPEEIAEAEAEWQAHTQAMNENRRATGERLIYPDAAQP